MLTFKLTLYDAKPQLFVKKLPLFVFAFDIRSLQSVEKNTIEYLFYPIYWLYEVGCPADFVYKT